MVDASSPRRSSLSPAAAQMPHRSVEQFSERRLNALRGGTMKRKILYWGATGLVATVAVLGGFSYVTNAPEAIENFRHVGYPAAVACPARHREARWRHRPAPATAADLEGMGLRRIHHHLDRGNRRALSGGRRVVVVARRVARALAVSYVTRPANRRGFATSMLAQGDGSTPLPASRPYGGFGRAVENLCAR